MVQAIANFMKMAYVQWNKDSVADETILADLRGMSGGQLKLEENVNLARVEYRANTHNQNTSRGRTNNNQNNKGGRSNNNNPRNNNNQNNRNRSNGGGGGTRKY
jgi:hypothetical protein